MRPATSDKTCKCGDGPGDESEQQRHDNAGCTHPEYEQLILDDSPTHCTDMDTKTVVTTAATQHHPEPQSSRTMMFSFQLAVLSTVATTD